MYSEIEVGIGRSLKKAKGEKKLKCPRDEKEKKWYPLSLRNAKRSFHDHSGAHLLVKSKENKLKKAAYLLYLLSEKLSSLHACRIKRQ